jgi:hypothetical protein
LFVAASHDRYVGADGHLSLSGLSWFTLLDKVVNAWHAVHEAGFKLCTSHERAELMRRSTPGVYLNPVLVYVIIPIFKPTPATLVYYMYQIVEIKRRIPFSSYFNRPSRPSREKISSICGLWSIRLDRYTGCNDGCAPVSKLIAAGAPFCHHVMNLLFEA